MKWGTFYPEEFSKQPKKIIGVVDHKEYHDRIRVADDIKIISVEESQAIGTIFTKKDVSKRINKELKTNMNK